MRVYLVGLANAGKSTIFNILTGSNIHTGNWHGVTVNKAAAICRFKGVDYQIFDLPGVYGMTPFSPEENVTVREILNNQDAVIVNIIDVNNFERSLNLTMQLIELGLSVVVGLNFVEDAKKRGTQIDARALSKSLGCEVSELCLNKKKLIEKFAFLVTRAHRMETPKYVENWQLDVVCSEMQTFCKSEYLKYNAIRLREGAFDEIRSCEIPLNKQTKMRKFSFPDGVKRITLDRQKNIEKIVLNSLKNRSKIPYGSSKLDKFILNKYLALPIFLAVMLVVFFITFGYVGDFLSGIVDYVIVDFIGGGLLYLLNTFSAPVWLVDFFNQAIIGGVGSVFGFLPQVVLLFLFLEILEQSGYISRLSWMFDSVFRRLGLSGRSVFSLLMGFGCSTTAVPTTVTMRNDRARVKTALLIPFMSCSAKLPIYSALAGAFFGAGSVFIIFALYLLGVGVAIMLALIAQKFYPTYTTEEILEFTPMRCPSARKILSIVSTNTSAFVRRIFGVLLACTIIIWFLNNFTFTLSYITNSSQTSILEGIAKFISPIFQPLGFEYGAVCALLFGLVAKELVLAGIAIMNGVSGSAVASSVLGGGVVTFTPASVIAFLVFCLLYSPCISALIQIRHATSKKVFWLYLVLQFVVAYAVSAVFYGICLLIMQIGGGEFAWLCFAVVAVFLILEAFIIRVINRRTCGTCNVCGGAHIRPKIKK